MGKNLKYCSEFTHDPKFGFTGSAGKTPVAGYLRKAAGGKVREHYSLSTTGKLQCGGPVKKARGGAIAQIAEEAEDKALIKKAVGQHDKQLHTGKKTVLKLRHGGMGSYKRGGAVPSYSAKPLVGSR